MGREEAGVGVHRNGLAAPRKVEEREAVAAAEDLVVVAHRLRPGDVATMLTGYFLRTCVMLRLTYSVSPAPSEVTTTPPRSGIRSWGAVQGFRWPLDMRATEKRRADPSCNTTLSKGGRPFRSRERTDWRFASPFATEISDMLRIVWYTSSMPARAASAACSTRSSDDAQRRAPRTRARRHSRGGGGSTSQSRSAASWSQDHPDPHVRHRWRSTRRSDRDRARATSGVLQALGFPLQSLRRRITESSAFQ